MAAKKTGGTAGRIRARNQAMAARMKDEGVERATLRCAICGGLVARDRYPIHLGACQGRR